MSENEIYFPKLISLREENLTLYLELKAYIEQIPNGPWHYVEGYDSSHNGTRYIFVLSNLYRPTEKASITALKNIPQIDGHYFSFFSNFMPSG